MTALCPSSGTSSPKSGLAEVVTLASGALALSMQRYGAAQLQFLIPLLGLAPLELAPFCATDPPAMPTFTSDEVYSLLRVGLDSDYFSGLEKARDMILHMLWYDMCECDAGTATTITPPSLPTNTPDLILPTGPTVSPCATFTQTSDAGLGGGTTSFWLGVVPLPRTAQRWRITSEGEIQSDDGTTYYYQMQENGTGSYVNTVATDNFTPNTHHEFQGIIANPNSTSLAAHYHWVSGGGTTFAHDTLEIYCGNDVPGLQQACCPPDPATQNSLDLILQMVTLIQRQAAPFSYVYGDNHAGLTGADEFAVSSLLGVSVDVTTAPPSYGTEAGTPLTYFGLGWVDLGTADGWLQSRRIDHDGTLFLPPLGGVFTRVGYSLAPGVTVAIRELKREP